MTLFHNIGQLGGSPDCPCIQPGNLNPPLCNKYNETQNVTQPHNKNITGIPCLPNDYGSFCKQHDLSFYPECSEDLDKSLISPRCNLEWCFVDADKCFLSQQTYEQFRLGLELYISSSTCGQSKKRWNPIDWTDEWVEDFVFEAVIADFEYPYHYIEEVDQNFIQPPGEEIYMGNGILKGILIDYLKELNLRTDIKQINFNLPSGGSKARYTSSSYTAAVNDVGKGIFDVGFGTFYVTSDRLSLSTFTLPLFESPVYLYELDGEPNREGFLHYTQKTFQPFTYGLVFVLVGVILTVGLVNVFISNQRGDYAAWHHALRNDDWKQTSNKHRFIMYIQITTESLIGSFIQCFGAATSVGQSSTMAHKVLAVGFGFFILVICASYTANLATFLTLEKPPDLIPSMEFAIENKIKICAPAALEVTLSSKYKGNVFFFVRGLPYVNQAIDHMKKGTCGAMAAEHSEVTTMIKDLCKHNLASMKTLVAEVSMAFPIRSEYASIFSRSQLTVAHEGIDFIELFKPYEVAMSGCTLYRTIDSSKANTQMKAMNLVFPVTVLISCMIFASCIKLTEGKRPKILVGFRKQSESIVQHELGHMACKDIKSDNEITDSDKMSENLYLLQSKYRVQRLYYRLKNVYDEIDEITDDHEIFLEQHNLSFEK